MILYNLRYTTEILHMGEVLQRNAQIWIAQVSDSYRNLLVRTDASIGITTPDRQEFSDTMERFLNDGVATQISVGSIRWFCRYCWRYLKH